MQNSHSAFLAGDYVTTRSDSALRQIQATHCDNTISVLGLHTVIPAEMASHANQVARILRVTFYHMGWVLYELEGLPYSWPEAAVRDRDLDVNGEPWYQPANLTYRAYVSDDGDFAIIRDHDGREFCRLRGRYASQLVGDINRVAALRTRSGFSSRYHFDGVEHFGSPSMTIRRAKPSEAAAITELGIWSKGYWGYSDEQMMTFRAELQITVDDIRVHPTFVACDGGRLLGYYSLVELDKTTIELWHLFVCRHEMNRGYGSELLRHAIEQARSTRYRRFVIQSDPNAVDFYNRHGITQVRQIPSSIPGRSIPFLEMYLEP